VVDDERASHGAEINQMMPVSVVPRETRSLERQNRPHSSVTNCGQQSAESWTFHGTCPGAAEVFVDHNEALEAKGNCAFAQIILTALTLQACTYLLHR
jgi:hypothetical protein